MLQVPPGVQHRSDSLAHLCGVGKFLYGVEDRTLVIANMASCLALLVKKKYSTMNIMVIPKEMSIEAVITHNDRTTQWMLNVNYAYYTRARDYKKRCHALLFEFYHLSFYHLQSK